MYKTSTNPGVRLCQHTRSKLARKNVGCNGWLAKDKRGCVARCQSTNGSIPKVKSKDTDSDPQTPPAEWLEVAQSQGKALASQVSTLRKSAEVGAAELESLQIQQNEDEEAGEELQSQLAEAEDEIAVLRLQAERAAILEVQSEISSRLVEDLQELSEMRSENLDQAMSRLKEVEGALVTALDEVESESLQSTKMLQAKDSETIRMRAMVAANKAEITRMAGELEGARGQLQEAAKVADEAQVQRSAIQVEVTSLRNKYETLQRNYNTVKRARKKKAKGKALVDIDTAEAEAKDLGERVDSLEKDLRAAHAQLGDASREHREALTDAEKAKQSLEKQVMALRAEAKERKEGSLKEVALLSMELDELRSNDFETKYEDAKDQVQKLEREIKLRNERFQDVEKQMVALREALASKGDALNAAKSELSELKRQVREQLTELQLSREKLKAANQTIEEQKSELSTLRHDLDDAHTELESKQSEVTELHGKVVSIRSHALKLEDELRAMNSGKSSNVQRVNELQQEVQIQKKNAVEAQQKLEQVQVDLEEVSLRERQLKETSGLLANELDKQRSNESTSASEIVDMRGQLSAMQQALQNKEHTMEELRAELQKGSQDMEQRDHEVSGLRSEIEKLKRRELGWATELQDAATVTSQLTERMEILESVLATKEEALSQAQGEIDEKDTELSTVKSDREKLEKEMQTMLQKEKEDIKVKGKGPGGMLHSALQQLQRELRREAVANEKLMVKAESLLKDGKEGKPRSSKSFAAPNVATTAALLSTMKDKAATMKDMKDKAATMKNKAATMKNKATTMKEEKAASEANEEAKVDEEQEDSNEEENEEQEADVLPVGETKADRASTPPTSNVQQLIKSLEQENSAMRQRMHGSMGDALKNSKSVGAYINSGNNVLNRAGFGGDRVRRATQGKPRQSVDGSVRPFMKSSMELRR